MKYNLIALDLDGTALTTDNTVQRSTAEAVRRARNAGAHVILATGRIVGEAAEFARQIGTDDLMVTGSGSSLSSVSTGRCFDRISLPWEAAVRAAAVVERVHMSTMVYCGDRLFLTPYCDAQFARYKNNEGYLASKVVVPSVAEYLATRHLSADKLFVRCENPSLLQLARRQLEQIAGLRVLSSAADNLEILALGANKADALRRAAAHLGTDLAHTVAIGDSENDLEMLGAAGMPVAMGNAPESVRRRARYVTADCNHGGVAQAIAHLLPQTAQESRTADGASA